MCCVKATILEEMPPFPERESSILAKLKKKRPDKVANNTIEPRAGTDANDNNAATQSTALVLDAACCYRCSVACLSVGHSCEPFCNGSSD